MAKPRSVYNYLDKGMQIPINLYTKHLVSGRIWRGALNWNNGSSVFVSINYKSAKPFMKLEYTCKGKSYNYIVDIVSVPSNLANGKNWYFECSVSHKRAKILYFVESLFVHRQAFPGQCYYHQCDSKNSRLINCLVPREKAAIAKLKPETIRIWYAGKPTKRYLMLLKTRQKYSQKYHDLYLSLTQKLNY